MSTVNGIRFAPDRSNFDMQSQMQINGYARVSKTGFVSWTNRIIIMTAGQRQQAPSGYHNAYMPAVGELIQVSNGTTRAVTAAVAGDELDYGGIQLNSWETLWKRFRRNAAQSTSTTAADWLIQQYTNSGEVGVNSLLGQSGSDAEEWVRIVSRDDQNHFWWGTGDTCALGGFIGSDNANTQNFFMNLRTNASGDGYFFCPGGVSGPTAATFGFTGAIRWINGGAQNYTSGVGYTQSLFNARPAGTVVKVFGGADRTWRLMTAAEKPQWFGGHTRGSQPIDAATSTVVDLNANEVLGWVPNPASPTVGTWYIFPFSALGSVMPVHFLPVATRLGIGNNGQIKVVIGQGVALSGGESVWSSNPAEFLAEIERRKFTFNGLVYVRWTPANFFSGTAANGILAGNPYTDGVMVSWDADRLIYGISEGRSNLGQDYFWVNVPAVGAQIPVVGGGNVTRTVVSIGGRAFIPLMPWETLGVVRPVGGPVSSASQDFLIATHYAYAQVPKGFRPVAKFANAQTTFGTTGINKNRILFADGNYYQPGVNRPASIAAQALNDHSQGSGDWRNITLVGQTPPGGTAALPAVAGVLGAYPGYTPSYNYLANNQDPRGIIQLAGLIQFNGLVTTPGAIIGFMAGVSVRGQQIKPALIMANPLGDSAPVMCQLRFSNAIIGGQSGVTIRIENLSMSASNPLLTLGVNGGNNPAPVPAWLSLDSVSNLHHA